MAARPEPEGLLADPEPFSPSVFLDLPRTPRPDGDGGSDDLVLLFIARILMEEDIDDKFLYQYPDHPALLDAQEPFAQILSEAAAGVSSSSDVNAATGLSPSSSDDDPASADATWQIELPQSSQLLHSPPYSSDTGELLDDDFTADNANASSLPPRGGPSAGFQQSPARPGNAGDADAFYAGHYGVHSSTSSLPVGDGDQQGTLVSAFFSGQNGEHTDMLNRAFLKGMEEANKFLPTNNCLLIDLSCGTTSGQHLPRDSKVLSRGLPTDQGKETGGGNVKRRHRSRDDLEPEMGRNKLMVPEPEETGEVIDEMIATGYDSCLEEMKNLRITMSSDSEKKIRKMSASGRQSTESVDLCTLLIHCAQAMATDNCRSAIELLRKIKQHSSPRGDATQRLAHCLAEGLEVRLTGSVKQVYKSIMAKRTSVVEFLEAYRLYLSACCFEMMSFKFSNMTIVKAVAGRKKVHIVDYDVHYGLQWPTFLGHLATREGGPPEVRITGIDLLQPGFRPTARVEETGRRLSNCARQFCVPFKFHGIAAKWETICVDDLNIDPDEVLIVNGSIHFGNLMDEGINIDSPSPRDVVLSNIRKMKPDVFILYIRNVSYNNPFFVSRFREVLFHYSAMFDMLDATAPRDNDLRLLIERDLFGQSALNAITCEGLDRVERPETYKQWQVRNHRAGLTQLPLDPDVVKVVRENVKEKYHKDFLIDVDDQWLLEGWKGRILHAMSTWAADDSVSRC
ncbi:hypothetical protein U9M48_011133 [Paspalum notatum var. saurae]|uniref:Scarecrow-like protein 9 n=1 Tax=Paspalum notatum var. saurae TaxID=547442 RepID=A0AAQ3SUW8_PASNO